MDARSSESTTRSLEAESQTPQRTFEDTGGRHWVAFERPFPADDWTSADEESARAGYGAGWLYFVSGVRRSRVRLYPLHWPRISDAELEVLCSRARRESDRD